MPLDSDEESARGGVTRRVIQALYSTFLAEFVGPDDIFMHDNAPVHTARIIRQLLDEIEIKFMP